MTEPLDVAQLQRRLAEFAAARNWQPYHTPKNLVAALSVEASELVEIFQWLTPEESDRVMDDPGTAHRVRDEVADVLAYLLQLCEVLGIDPLAALAAKIERNEQRFPRPEEAPPTGEPTRGPSGGQAREPSGDRGGGAGDGPVGD
ncbi:nucleotide pyrophosphohydrolase [Streptomyces actuosus]|uniref:nucleotide pyrophosphohydrolase n=1 Tax=Streptomyces actuosus TaxID=1885 RepID=UPI0027DA9F47|nr:nucleotide pyrophosphohydrolase [Streptomyces actuosus]